MTTTADTRSTIADADLRADVEDELEWDPAVPVTNIGVSVTDHAVTLSGSVRRLSDRFAAVRAAQRVKGVHAVIDEIAVIGEIGSADSDEQIGRNIERILESHALVPSTVKATVRDRIVELSGKVDHQYQRDAAQRAVRDVKHILLVRNNIIVDSKVSENVVRANIVAAMHRNASLEANDIHVLTTGHDVWLSGTARSFVARRQAECAAWSAPGVRHVHNNIIVS